MKKYHCLLNTTDSNTLSSHVSLLQSTSNTLIVNSIQVFDTAPISLETEIRIQAIDSAKMKTTFQPQPTSAPNLNAQSCVKDWQTVRKQIFTHLQVDVGCTGRAIVPTLSHIRIIFTVMVCLLSHFQIYTQSCVIKFACVHVCMYVCMSVCPQKAPKPCLLR